MSRNTLPAAPPPTAGLDALPQPAWIEDDGGRLQYVNPACVALTGVALPAALGRAAAEALDLDAAPDEGRLGPARRVHQLERRPWPGGGILVVATDVHERAQAHANLAAQARMLQDIVDANADCIKVLDADARLLAMNVGGLQAMEVDDFQACLNAAWPDFWQGEDRSLVDAALAAARAGGVGSFEGYCPTLKGTPKWWHVTVTPIRGEGGEVTRLLATSRDITRRKQDEAALRELNASLEARVAARTEALHHTVEQLRRSNTELERFAYVAAHDLQEPIRTVASFSELLLARHGDALGERGRGYLDLVVGGARRMKALVDDLLALSRLGHASAPPQPVPAGGPLAEALARLDARVRESGARVHIGPLPTVQADAPQLVQLFQNLVGNALKFASPGAAPEVQVSARPEGACWQFTVADHGIGIEAAYFGRIFEPFQRLHPREHYEGSGVGLSICRKIVEAHGGHIWVESAPGEGTAFHFTLPAAQA